MTVSTTNTDERLTMEIRPVKAPARKRTEADDAITALKALDHGWGAISADTEDIAKTIKRDLTRAAKYVDERVKYEYNADKKLLYAAIAKKRAVKPAENA